MITPMKVFEELNKLNVNEHTEKKKVSGKDLTYLSWPWAWAEVKKRYPDAHYDIWKNENNLPYAYDPDTGYIVYTSVTIEGVTHDMWLAVMDGANKAMKREAYQYKVNNPNFKYAKKQPDGRYIDQYGKEQPEFFNKTVDPASMTDINKTLMRCLVKNLAMFGLGLYIYAGEDLPEVEAPTPEPVPDKPVDKKNGKGTVSKTDTIPPEEEKPATDQKQADPQVLAYIKNEIQFMAERNELPFLQMKARFETFRKELVRGKAVPDIVYTEMTMDDAKNLVEAVYTTYMTDKKDDG